jgi:hypothetical protein
MTLFRHAKFVGEDHMMCGKPTKKDNDNVRWPWWAVLICRRCFRQVLAQHNQRTNESNERGHRLAAIERELYR